MDEEEKGTPINLETIMKRIQGDDSSPSHDSFDSDSDQDLAKPSALAGNFKNSKSEAKPVEKSTTFTKSLMSYGIIQKMRDKGMLKPKKTPSPALDKGILKSLDPKTPSKYKKVKFANSPRKKPVNSPRLSSQQLNKKADLSPMKKRSPAKSPMSPKSPSTAKSNSAIKNISSAFLEALQK